MNMPGNDNKPGDNERIVEIEMERLRPFHSHPFKVKDDQEMKDLIDSISRYGILTPWSSARSRRVCMRSSPATAENMLPSSSDFVSSL